MNTAGLQSRVLLELSGLEKRFGGVVAVNGVSAVVSSGEIVGLVGPNGAGKTTLLNLISGFDRALHSGEVRFDGRDVTAWAPHRLSRAGLVRTFQHAHTFGSLSVEESLLAAGFVEQGAHKPFGWRGLWSRRRASGETEERAKRVLHSLRLERWAFVKCSQLPYGTKKRLGIGVALMRNPALLLLDEPAAGLNTKETVDLVQDLQRINRDGVTMIVVEHNMPLIMAVSDRIVVLDHGVKIAEGLPKKSLQTNK